MATVLENLLKGFPDLLGEVLCSLKLPPKSPEYKPMKTEIFFDDVLVSVQGERGKPNRDLGLDVDFIPSVIALYGDDELLLVKARGQVVLNRLPDLFEENEWVSLSK